MSDDETDWRSTPPDKASFWEVVFHRFMIGLGLAIIFGISGTLTYLKLLDFPNPALNETPFTAALKFSAGGTLGVATILILYFRKDRPIP